MENKLKRYAEIKLEMVRLTNELKALKADVMTIVFEEDDMKLETDFGSFSLRDGRKTWKYSDKLTLKEKQVKEAFKIKKKQEELEGIATLEKAPTNLVFVAKKG